MLKAVVLLCLVASSLAGYVRPRFQVSKRVRHGRIVGGTAARIEDHPWQVSVQYYGLHNCGGSIITTDDVLTAAHCVEGYNVNLLSVRSGSSRTDEGGTVTSLSYGYYHTLYDPDTMDYDIGILKLPTELVFGPTTNAVILPTSYKELDGGATVNITGWGYDQTGGDLSLNLQQISTSVIDRDVCKVLYYGINTITSRMVCAGNHNITNAGVICSGDSGGPLVSDGVLFGVVSWSASVCEAYPSVLSSVVDESLREYIRVTAGV